MVHTRGGTVLSMNKTRQFIVMVENGHVLLVKNIMDEDQSNSHSKLSTSTTFLHNIALWLVSCLPFLSNYNYGQAGKALNLDLTNNPDLVATDATVSFKTALWFWMTAQANKPSSHDVITGRWTPSSADTSAGRVPGFGVITNIINGGIECGHGQDDRVQDRVGFYQRYCQLMGINPGGNLDCNSQRPFA